MNVLIFTANLGRDAETKYLPSGESVTQFSAPLSAGYGDKKLTTWINCTIWGKRGEALKPMLLKGTQVALQGEFAIRTYVGKDGVEKSSPEVNVREVTLLGGKPQPVASGKVEKPDSPIDDEDLPF